MEEYYYIDAAGLQQGPVPADRLIALGVGRKTPVWKAGMAEWASAESLPELASLFAEQPPQYNQPARYYDEPRPAKPESYLIWAILATICCCLPFGVASIIYAARVDGLWLQGKYDEAEANSRKARNWAIAAAVVGFVSSILYSIAIFALDPNIKDAIYLNY